MRSKKLAVLLMAAVLTFSAASCSSDKNKTSSKAEKKTKDKNVSTVVDDSSEDETVTDQQTEHVPSAKDGEYINKAYDILTGQRYSLKLVYTDNYGYNTEIYRVVDGNNYYELQKGKSSECGCICVTGNAYDFDTVCGIYRKRSSGKPDSVIVNVVDKDLPATETNINAEDAEKYEVEEYTYTGGSYITVLDFYFDKTTGLPAKYTTRYMVEKENGDEGMTETRTVRELIYTDGDELVATDGETRELDQSVFDLSFISELKDFDSMTPEQKLGYCQAIFVTANVTQDELNTAGMTDEKLRNISYDDFTTLVYTYGFDQ